MIVGTFPGKMPINYIEVIAEDGTIYAINKDNGAIYIKKYVIDVDNDSNRMRGRPAVDGPGRFEYKQVLPNKFLNTVLPNIKDEDLKLEVTKIIVRNI
jgi:hypothetical protein